MSKKSASPAGKKAPRVLISARVSTRLKQLLVDSAELHGLQLGPWVERLLWASKDVQQALMQSAANSDLSVPVSLYTLDEVTLAHLTLLARATNHLEEIARVVVRCRLERWVLDEMRLAESLHAVKDQLEKLRPLHLARKTSGARKEAFGKTCS